MELEERAEESAGNWKKFESFAWHDKPETPEDWAIFYTHNRDSRLLEESNAAQIEKSLEKYFDIEPEVIRSEHHTHWAVGWIDGYAIRVYSSPTNRSITDVFKEWCELEDAVESYPVLNSEDYSRRELEATMENIKQPSWRYSMEDWPEDWAGQLYSYFSDHNPRAIENRDDQGGYPRDNELLDAIRGMGWSEE